MRVTTLVVLGAVLGSSAHAVETEDASYAIIKGTRSREECRTLSKSLLAGRKSSDPSGSFGSIVGTVKDRRGKPIAGALVSFFTSSQNAGTLAINDFAGKTVTSDAEGRFLLDFQSADPQLVTTFARGYREASVLVEPSSLCMAFLLAPMPTKQELDCRKRGGKWEPAEGACKS